MSTSSTATALWSRPDEARRREAERHVGELAAVYFSSFRDPNNLSRIVGEVLAVARPATGAVTAAVVVRSVDGLTDRPTAWAVSLATVYAIRRAPEEPGEEVAT